MRKNKNLGIAVTLFAMVLFALAPEAVGAPQAGLKTPGAGLHPRIQQMTAPDTFESCTDLTGARQFNCVVSDIIVRENQLVQTLQKYRPLMEVYIQDVKPDAELGVVPVDDHYFLGQVRFRRNKTINVQSLLPLPSFASRLSRGVGGPITGFISPHYRPSDFYFSLVMDTRRFNRRFYNFSFVRQQFLGNVRCLVFDVTPKLHTYRHFLLLHYEDIGLFEGRIWVEDHNYHIVRFNGTFAPSPPGTAYFHFDSWRENVRPGLWLPAYAYSQESDLKYGLNRTMRFRAQIRFWGYGLQNPSRQTEMTQIQVESPGQVKDLNAGSGDFSPVLSQRAWQEQAQDNVLDRLQKAGLLAPPGPVDQVLGTVVNNLIVTNHLNNVPAVQCRVLLTSTLESFAVGDTIVLSRGLIDVLPDEPSLAAMLSYELARIVLQQTVNINSSKWAFEDRLMVPNDELLSILDFKTSARNEEAADKKAIELLQNSPYKDQLGKAGLFLRAMAQVAPHTPHLFGAQLGNRLVAKKGQVLQLAALMTGAPKLEERDVDQIAALPLGARVGVDSWNDQIQLMKTKPVPLLSAREKMPFEIVPIFPYLTRLPTEQARR